MPSELNDEDSEALYGRFIHDDDRYLQCNSIRNSAHRIVNRVRGKIEF